MPNATGRELVMIAFSVRDLSIVDWQFRAGIVDRVRGRLGVELALVTADRSLGHARVVRSARRRVRRRQHQRALRLLPDPRMRCLGRRAADQISAAGFRRLEQEYLQRFHGHGYLYGRVASPRRGRSRYTAS